jgi:predicted PurR-regulated permease PerM
MAGIFRQAYNSKWLVLGLLLILLLAWVAWPFLTVIVYGIFIYYVAKPIKRKLRPYIKNDTALVSACMFLMALPFILIISYTLLLALSQFNAVAASVGLQSMAGGPLSNMSSNIVNIEHNASLQGVMSGNFTTAIHQVWSSGLASYSGSIVSLQNILVSTGMTIVDVIFKIFLMIVIAFYLLREDENIKVWFARTFPTLVREHDGVLVRYYHAVDQDLEKIFFGNIISIVFFAIVAVVIFSLLNFVAPASQFLIPYPLLLGMLCGVAALIPVVGMYLVTVPALLYILSRALSAGILMPHILFFIVMILTIFIFVQTVPEILIRPFVARGQVNTGLLMFAYILGPVVFGVAGLFIGAIVLVLLTHYFRIVLPQLTGEGHPA